MTPTPDLVAALRTLMGANGGESARLPDGRSQITFRNIPPQQATTFSYRCDGAARFKPCAAVDSVRAAEDAERAEKACETHSKVGCEECKGDRAIGGKATEPGFKSIGSVEGIASSTSRDWYGTEMSLDALNRMADQFMSTAGVPLLPCHGSWIETPEWDSVIGRSVACKVERAQVAEAYNPAEAQYTLTVESALIECEKAVSLQKRIDAGQVIGQSIGGWFTAMSVIYNEDTDELERIIILDVQLDHLAVTRMPANPDSIGLTSLRSRVGDVFRSLPRPATGGVPAARSAGNPASVTGDKRSDGTLDTVPVAGNDAPNAADAAPSEELSMTPEQIADLIKRSITENLGATIGPAVRSAVQDEIKAQLDPLKVELAALRAKVDAPTPAPATRAAPASAPAASLSADADIDDDATKALKREVEQLRRTVTNLADAPNRRAVHGPSAVPIVSRGAGAEASFSSIVTECRSKGIGVGLAAVVERHVKTIAEEDGPAPVSSTGSARALTGILAAGLRAAESDGLLTAPSGW